MSQDTCVTVIFLSPPPSDLAAALSKSIEQFDLSPDDFDGPAAQLDELPNGIVSLKGRNMGDLVAQELLAAAKEAQTSIALSKNLIKPPTCG